MQAQVILKCKRSVSNQLKSSFPIIVIILDPSHTDSGAHDETLRAGAALITQRRRRRRTSCDECGIKVGKNQLSERIEKNTAKLYSDALVLD